MNSPVKPLKTLFKEAFVVAILASIVFISVNGLVLDVWSFKSELPRALTLVAIVLGFKIGFGIMPRIPYAGSKLADFFTQKNLGVIIERPEERKNTGLWVCLLLGVCAVLPFFLSKYLIGILIQCLIYVLLGLGLNIVVGLAGLLDLGFVAFYAVGAYSLGMLHTYLGLGFWSVLPIAIILSGIVGAILGFPVLKMHGDYLAIVTLGFGEIIRLLLNNMVDITGGPNGMRVPGISFFGLIFKRRSKDGTTFHEFFGLQYDRVDKDIFIYLLLLIFVAIITFICIKLKKMPIGRAWEALREDEIACRAMGINHVSIKLAAFTMGAMIGGIGGVFFGGYQGFINPTSFTFLESALIVSIVVLGGLGSIPGVIIAAVVLNLLPELLREFSSYRILMFGIAMVVMMVWRPRGLLRIRRPAFLTSTSADTKDKEAG